MRLELGIEKAFILAGGEGTRLRPITYEIPKVLMPVKGKPIIQYNLELVKKFQVKEVVLGLGYKAEIVRKFVEEKLSDLGLKIHFNVEDEFLGTAGALKHARKHFDKKFIMMNGDELKNIDFEKVNEVHEKNNATATIALTKIDDPSDWGVVKMNGNKILEFVEKPSVEEAPSNLINSGAYILEPEIFEFIPDGNSSIERDVFPKLAEKGKLFGCEFSGQWFPADNFERYEAAIKNWKGVF